MSALEGIETKPSCLSLHYKKAFAVIGVAVVIVAILGLSLSQHVRTTTQNILTHKLTMLQVGLYIELPLTVAFIGIMVIQRYLKDNEKYGETTLKTTLQEMTHFSPKTKKVIGIGLAILGTLAVVSLGFYLKSSSFHAITNKFLNLKAPLWVTIATITGSSLLYMGIKQAYTSYVESKKDNHSSSQDSFIVSVDKTD